jgi:hypothetical protein
MKKLQWVLTLSLIAVSSVAAAATDKVELRYQPHPLQWLKVTETEREEVAELQPAPGAPVTAPVTRTTVYQYEKIYRRAVEPRKQGGLTIHLTVDSAHLEVNGAPAGKDLGGMKDSDWIDARGKPGGMGNVEDPFRPEMPLPENAVGQGDAWSEEGPPVPALPFPVQWTGRVKEKKVLADKRVVLILEIDGRRQGPIPPKKMYLDWREQTRVTFEPATGAVLRMETKSKRKEVYPYPEAPARIVEVSIDRETRSMKKPPPH